MSDSPAKRGGKRTDVGPGRPPVEHQFKPGHPGGPGRPKGVAVSTAIKKILDTQAEAEAVAKGIIQKAKQGDPAAFKALMDRYEGPLTQAFEGNVNTGGALTEEQAAAVLSQIQAMANTETDGE